MGVSTMYGEGVIQIYLLLKFQIQVVDKGGTHVPNSYQRRI